jgi:hypothetical protein
VKLGNTEYRYFTNLLASAIVHRTKNYWKLNDMDFLKERFLAFAETECKGNSSLYYKLSIRIANDPELLGMAVNTRKGQPVPNIFFAAVHFLLLKNPNERLAGYYPSIRQNPPAEIPFDLFKAFCLDNKDEINRIISARIVQTNVISRCAYLLPIFSKIIVEENKPATIIDIGTSAGLTLNFDKYEYWYNGQKVFGESNVLVKSTIIGSPIPKIYKISQPIQKVGIDQNLIDLTDKDEIMWLKALVWADQLERFDALDAALKLNESERINFIQAGSVPDFEQEMLKADRGRSLIVYATHVLYQFTQARRDEFYDMLDRVGQVRDFYFLSVEGIKSLLEKYHSDETVIELTSYKNKRKTVNFLAETNGHGNWIRWQ